MENWIRQFKWYFFESLPSAYQKKALQEVIEELRPELYTEKGWFADYRRLRLIAVKV